MKYEFTLERADGSEVSFVGNIQAKHTLRKYFGLLGFRSLKWRLRDEITQ